MTSGQDEPLFDSTTWATVHPLNPHTHARTGDPDTSHEAAHRLSDQRTMMRILLTTYLRTNRTCEEAARTAGYEHEKATKRVSDLERLGLITDTGQRRPGSSGRLQKVCAITTKGREAL